MKKNVKKKRKGDRHIFKKTVFFLKKIKNVKKVGKKRRARQALALFFSEKAHSSQVTILKSVKMWA